MSARDIQAAIALILIVGGVAVFSIPIAAIVGGALLLLDRIT